MHIMMMMMMDCTRCVSGYGGRRASSTGQEYILLLRGERRILTKMKTILKNNMPSAMLL